MLSTIDKPNGKDETINEVLELKNEAEQATKSSVGERESLKQKLKFVRAQKATILKSTLERSAEKLKIEIELEDLEQEIDMLKTHCNLRHEQQNDFLSSIYDQIQMSDFDSGMRQLRASIENGIVFYRDENLHMELHKRKNVTRNLRVKYTEAETAYKERLRRIEEEKRQAELERLRKEEVERRKAEEEQRRLEEDRRRAELVSAQRSPDPWKSPISGRSSVDTSGRGSEFGQRTFEDPKSNVPNERSEASTVGGAAFGLSSFTQLLKW